MDNNTTRHQARKLSLDLIRAVAILLVVWQHTSEFYYIGPDNSLTEPQVTTQVGFIDSLARTCVPLFVMISGYLLLPMRTSTTTFFKRRFSRILFPWLFWCVAYAVYFVWYRGDSAVDCILNICKIPVNWGVDVGHLWFIYMLMGVYLLVPVLSPWLNSCSRKQLRFYLSLWVITTFLPCLHTIWPQMWGECAWNPTPTLYYFTGFAGYFVLGYYIKRFGHWGLWQSIAGLVFGYMLAAAGFILRIPVAQDTVDLEMAWSFCGFPVALMTLSLFSLLMRINDLRAPWLNRIITRIAIYSYAIYFIHIMFLNFFHDLIGGCLGSVLAEIPVIAISTFIVSYIAIRVLSLLPATRYWLGVDKH